jgi:hypothetical protein
MTDNRTINRLADQIAGIGQTSNVTVGLHEVTVVAKAGAKGGVDPALSVLIGSKDVQSPALASYHSPTVGDVVCVLVVDNAPTILGKVASRPNV